MASSSNPNLQQQADAVTKEVKRLLNRDLQDILKSENLAISGVKATLQSRILERLQDAVISTDYVRFDELRQKILKAAPASTSYQSRNYSNGTRSYAGHNNSSHPSMPAGWNSSPPSGTQSQYSWLRFKDSPFYEIKQRLTTWHDLPVMNTHRHTVSAQLSLDSNTADLLRQNHSIRIMLYCTSPAGPYNSDNTVDITFPGQVEIKVNNQSVHANLRGIKKKPGTTKPADITAYVQKKVNSETPVDITYAQTEKKYSFVIQLVQKHSVEELVDRIKRRSMISKQSVINEMITRANDPDIEATSTVMSLKCPLSAMRMELPCRSSICNHNQCFDASSFLQAQEQAPQWSCPTCSKAFQFEALAVDQYVQDILNSTPKSTEQITIEPDGTWRQDGSNDSFRVPEKRKPPDAWEYDDLVEIHDYRTNGSGQEFSSTPQSYNKTPNSSSREPSMASTAPHSINGKRSAKEVIDLTLSDEEDEPPRPIKRQSMSSLHPTQSPRPIPSRTQNGFTPFSLAQPQSSHPTYHSPGYAPHNYGQYLDFDSS